MPSKLPRVTSRMEQIHIGKLKFIAEKNDRSLSKEVRHVLMRYIESYEKKYGEIKL